MSEFDDLSQLAPAAALGSLPDEERTAYDAYLAATANARREADSFSSVVRSLGQDRAEEPPPAALKARLMAQIAVTPQLTGRPLVEPHPPLHLAPHQAASPRPIEEGAHQPAEPPATDTTPSTAPTRAEDRARARWFARPSVVLVAAAAAVGLFVGGTAVGIAVGNGSGASISEQASTFAQISAAPDAQRTSAKVTGGGSATLVFSHDMGKSAVVVDGAPTPPAGKTYQLWYIRDGKATSAGLLPDSSTKSWQVLDGSMKKGDTIGMTVEPSSGSSKPTTTPVVLIES